MTSLIGAKKRAEEFAAALEGEVAWTDLHPELADLAGLVDNLRAHDPVEPSAEFTASLRERLLAEADELYAQDAVLTLPERRHGRRERRFAIAAASLVFVGGTAGMAAAAQQALPGDALYPIKRGLENAQAGLATNDETKGRDLLDQAGTRLTEIQSMVDGSASQSQLPPTIEAFTTQAQQGSKLLMKSYAQNHHQQSIETVRSFTTHSLKVLQTVAGSAPADQQEELTRAAMALLHIDGQAIHTCKSCAPDLPALQMPKLFAVSADVTRALGRAEKSGGMSNDHPALPVNPAPSSGQQPSTGGSATGTGGSSTQPQFPGLPSGGDTSGGGGDNTGGSGGSHPLKHTIKGVTKGGDGVVPKDKGEIKNDVKGLLDPLLP